MKRTSMLSACLFLVVLLTASVALSQTSAEYKSKIAVINKEMAKDMIEGNMEKTLALYTDDAISMPSNEPMREGIAAIRKASEEMAKTGWKCEAFEANTLKVMVNGKEITEIGTYKMSMTMPGMDMPMDDNGKYLTVWEKQKDGSLKMKIEIWNSDINPMSKMKPMN